MSEHANEIRRRAEQANSTPVRIALFGQPGAGKSSIINAIIGEEKAKVGVGTDTTQKREDYEWNGLYLCDLPGYGTTMFPIEGYLERFDILSFDVFICVSAGKFSAGDNEFYSKLREFEKPCVFIRNKLDAIKQRGKTLEQLCTEIVDDLHAMTGQNEVVIFTSCDTGKGLDQLIHAVEGRLSGLKSERFLRSAKAYSKDFLDKKREACERYSTLAAGAAAVTNLVPVPGVGFSADVAAVATLLTSITRDFGLNTQRLNSLATMYPAIAPVVSQMIQSLGRDGALWLLKRYAGRVVAAELSKQFLPIVGPLIAASLSFLTIRYVASSHIESCYEVAEKMLEEELRT